MAGEGRGGRGQQDAARVETRHARRSGQPRARGGGGTGLEEPAENGEARPVHRDSRDLPCPSQQLALPIVLEQLRLEQSRLSGAATLRQRTKRAVDKTGSGQDGQWTRRAADKKGSGQDGQRTTRAVDKKSSGQDGQRTRRALDKTGSGQDGQWTRRAVDKTGSGQDGHWTGGVGVARWPAETVARESLTGPRPADCFVTCARSGRGGGGPGDISGLGRPPPS